MVWAIKQLGDICQIKPPKKEAKEILAESDMVSFVPMKDLGVTRKSISLNEERVLAEVSGSYTYFAENDVLLAKITPCFENGKLGIAKNLTNGVGFGSSEFIVFRPNSEIDPEFLFYFLSQDSFRESGTRSMTGAVGHKRVSREFIESYPMPVPPLAEQKRIIAILDKVFEGIATATANAERNLQNTRELFDSHLSTIFDQSRPDPDWLVQVVAGDRAIGSSRLIGDDENVNTVRSGAKGRAATDRVIPGDLSLSVGKPLLPHRSGWNWSKLTDVAGLESGHTPSRRHPEYWEGSIPWIGIKDARENHGEVITDTAQHTNQLGLDNSAARLLPAGTVCLSRTASVGYVLVTGCEMATSQDFVNWVCSSSVNPHFLKYLLIAEGDGFSKYSSGSVHQTIYFPEVKAFHICHPNIEAQERIVEFLDRVRSETRRASEIFSRKIKLLAELKQSFLHQAFSGALTARKNDTDFVSKRANA